MARQLEARLEELQLERARLQETVRRVGESLGKGLDRDALLGIVVQTAVDGVGAECGRVVMRHGANGTLVRGRARRQRLVLPGAPCRPPRRPRSRRASAAETQISGANALARPLHAPEPRGRRARRDLDRAARPPVHASASASCSPTSTNQAAISIENVDLHETIQRQAVTDELTGLFNHRRFQEVMTAEVERDAALRPGARPDHARHRQLQARQRHVRPPPGRPRAARGRARAARVLARDRRAGPLRRRGDGGRAARRPGCEGAYEFAERVRQRIEALELPLLDGEGTLRVTASFGAASLPHSAKIDKDALVAAADAALYRAKRSGKNRTVKAE